MQYHDRICTDAIKIVSVHCFCEVKMADSEGKKYRTGLVLEGGAMRGMFTCGVLDVFMENGITFDGAAGISAGAVFGCNFKSKQIGRPIRYNMKYCNDKRYCSC